MRAIAEGDMAIGASAGIKSVRFREACGIAVGRTVKQPKLFAFCETAPGDLDFFRRIAVKEGQRGFEAKHLLHRAGL